MTLWMTQSIFQWRDICYKKPVICFISRSTISTPTTQCLRCRYTMILCLDAMMFASTPSVFCLTRSPPSANATNFTLRFISKVYLVWKCNSPWIQPFSTLKMTVVFIGRNLTLLECPLVLTRVGIFISGILAGGQHPRWWLHTIHWSASSL